MNIRFEKVSKIYDDGTKAVKEADFEIQSGEFLVLVGPSGCGKSTILRMIAGLEEVTEGNILFDDIIINDLPPKKRNIGMVFQNYALYPHMTVFENIAFPLKILKYKKNIIKEKITEIAEFTGLQNELNKKPKNLSGGQRQRVALARAIAREPELFLFDEPLSNLDAKLRVKMRSEIRKIHDNMNATSVYVTHDQTEAMTMGTKIIILKDGIIQQIAKPSDLYHKPVNIFVAGFIGSPQMNFFKGIIEARSGYIFEEEHGKNIFSVNKSHLRFTDTISEGKYTLGIRPENIEIMSSPRDSTDFIKTKIENIEYLGNETFIYFTLNDELKCVRTNKNVIYEKGDSVYFIFDKSKYHYFNETGERI
jgi:multiple sugar transport system ATP-binding protein